LSTVEKPPFLAPKRFLSKRYGTRFEYLLGTDSLASNDSLNLFSDAYREEDLSDAQRPRIG
jgi:hypothetical protein